MATTKSYLDSEGLQHLLTLLKERNIWNKGLSELDFTTALKNKYDTASSSASQVAGINSRLQAIEQLMTEEPGATDKAIDKFNEIVDFLNGIDNTQTLAPIIADVAANKSKLAGIEEGAQKNTVTSVAGRTGAIVLKKADITDFPSSLKNPTALTLTIKGGSTEGTDKVTYDGSAAKSLDITAAKLGALTTHQSIYQATFSAGKFTAVTYNPKSAAATINVPTNTSHLTNDSHYVTSTDTTAFSAMSNADIDGIISTVNGAETIE